MSVPRCGFRCGHSSRRIPARRYRSWMTRKRRDRLVGAPRQFQNRLLLEAGRVVEAHVALGASREDFAAVGGEIDRIKSMVERHPLLQPMALHIDARQGRIHTVGVLPVGTQHGRENQRRQRLEVRVGQLSGLDVERHQRRHRRRVSAPFLSSE